MLGLLVLAGLATASVLPDMLSTKLDADASDPEASQDGTDTGADGDGNILDTLEPAASASASLEAGAEADDPVVFNATAGAHIIKDFDAESDRLIVNLPADSEDLDVVAADPETGTPPTMSWEQEDGLVEVQFDALDDVPVDRITMQFDGIDHEIALADIIEAQGAAVGATVGSFDDDALLPSDAELPSEPGPDSASDDEALSPTDPELPDEPDTSPSETPDDDAPLATLVADPDILPDGEDVPDGTSPPEIIRDFTPGEDLLVLDGDPGAEVLTMAAPDGSGTHVFVNDQLVATVMGVSEIDPDDIVFAPENAAAA